MSTGKENIQKDCDNIWWTLVHSMWRIVALSCVWTAVLVGIILGLILIPSSPAPGHGGGGKGRAPVSNSLAAKTTVELQESEKALRQRLEADSKDEKAAAELKEVEMNLEYRRRLEEVEQNLEPTPLTSVPLVGLATVVLIFALDVGVLWMLRKLGGPLKADVTATIEKFGGRLTIAGAGLVGCFLAVAAAAFGGLYLVTSIMKR